MGWQPCPHAPPLSHQKACSLASLAQGHPPSGAGRSAAGSESDALTLRRADVQQHVGEAGVNPQPSHVPAMGCVMWPSRSRAPRSPRAFSTPAAPASAVVSASAGHRPSPLPIPRDAAPRGGDWPLGVRVGSGEAVGAGHSSTRAERNAPGPVGLPVLGVGRHWPGCIVW